MSSNKIEVDRILQQAEFFIEQGESQRAAKILEKVTRDSFETSELYAYSLKASGDFVKAAGEYIRVIGQYGGDAAMWVTLGSACYNLDNFRLAIFCMDMAIESQGDDIDAHLHKSAILMSKWQKSQEGEQSNNDLHRSLSSAEEALKLAEAAGGQEWIERSMEQVKDVKRLISNNSRVNA